MDDYIKRKDALQRLESCVGWSRPSESAYKDIQAMPAADVASVAHSYWIVNSGNPSQGTCGNCGGKGNWRNPYCPNCGAKMDKEDNMSENKKPRLAEVLGVEVGEKFDVDGRSFSPYMVTDKGFVIDREGEIDYEVATYLLNDLSRLIRRPRWTKQEVKDAKAIRRILPEARDIERITETLTVVRDEDGFCLLTLQKDMFPNVKEGPAVKLADIIGVEEDT